VTVVGIQPAREFWLRTRLLAALAQAFPVQFVPIESSPGTRLDALVAFARESPDNAVDGPRKYFVVDSPTVGTTAERIVHFTDSALLDARLRGRNLCDKRLTEFALQAREGDDVLALAEGRPIWLKRNTTAGTTDIVSSGPRELAEGEFLKDKLDPGQFFELLPLVHFLRELCEPSAWTAPPTRAAFVVDGPNLHWHSYGHLRFRELVTRAREHGYHAAMAMVPLDGWYAHAPTVRLFRENTDVLSLCVHGNDHRKEDLARPASEDDARRILAQAVRRVAVFEKRTGLAVSRVMIPPHEACSPETMDVMLDLGFEAVSVTRPYPWMPWGTPHSPYASPDGNQLLSGWHIAELVRDGVPVMLRREFREHDEIVLRSYLDQPIILYGHDVDFSNGLEPLERAAELVNRTSPVEWGSLGDLAAMNFESRRHGDSLEIRPFSRRIKVRVEPDVAEITLSPPPRATGFSYGVEVAIGGWRREVPPAEDVVLLPRDRSHAVAVDIRWRGAREVSAALMPRPRRALGPLPRRFAVEARDRLAPLLHRRHASGPPQ
jgi:hypothetical protein